MTLETVWLVWTTAWGEMVLVGVCASKIVANAFIEARVAEHSADDRRASVADYTIIEWKVRR